MNFIRCFFLFAYLSFSTFTLNAQVYDGNLIFSNQDALDNYTGGYTEIDGDIQISGDVTDLSPLLGIKKVTRRVLISNTTLTDLSGLDSLTSIEGELAIRYNDALESLSGLNQLEEVLDDLGWSDAIQIKDNPLLPNLDALEDLQEVIGSIVIEDNENLEYINGFLGLNYISELSIIKCPIKDLNGFQNIETIDRLRLDDLDALENIDGLSGLQTVTEVIYINAAPLLQNINGLNNLSYLGQSIDIYSCNLLTTIPLSNLTTVDFGFIRIGGNELLENIAINNLSEALTELRVFVNNCPNLSAIELNAIDTVGLYMYDCGISTIDGFQNIEALDFLVLNDNPNLASLPSFDEVSFVKNSFVLYSNPSLNNFDNFTNINTVLGDFKLYNNDGITSLESFSNLSQLSKDSEVRIGLENIESLYGLHNIERIRNKLTLWSNSNLIDFTAIANIDLDTLNALSILGNSSIQDLSGLEDVKVVGELRIDINANLQTLDHLEALNKIGWKLIILNNDQLADLNGLTNARLFQQNQSERNEVIIAGNDLISHLGGLTNIWSPSGTEILINDNDNLVDITALYPLRLMLGNSVISENDMLPSLEGIQFIDTLVNLNIENNNSLSNCLALCPLLENAYIYGDIEISGNPMPCESIPSITACLTPLEEIDEVSYKVFPNPTTGSLFIEHEGDANLHYEILDHLGRKLASGSIINNKIDLNLSTGMYWISIFKEDQMIISERFVFQR